MRNEQSIDRECCVYCRMSAVCSVGKMSLNFWHTLHSVVYVYLLHFLLGVIVRVVVLIDVNKNFYYFFGRRRREQCVGFFFFPSPVSLVCFLVFSYPYPSFAVTCLSAYRYFISSDFDSSSSSFSF